MFDHIPNEAIRVLDLGTGDGRLLRLLINKRPDIHAVAMDISPIMLESVKSNFADEPNIQIIEHNLNNPLPNIGYFDAVISGFTIHHLSHERKRSLYQETYRILNPKGIFCNWTMLLHLPGNTIFDFFMQ